jgi:murein DD-endopeptidase MepM/ murein hydrolase activator NlpD
VREPQIATLTPVRETNPAAVAAAGVTTPTPAARPRTAVHAVQPGETLIAIALRYEITVEALAQANGLLDPDLLRIGQKLIIPLDGIVPGADSPATPATEPQPLNVALPAMRFACPVTSEVRPILLPADPIRLLVVDEMLYLIADGALYGLPVADVVEQESILPIYLSPADGRVGDVLIEELVYLTLDEATGDLLLLDKSNDIYRYAREGVWSVEILARPIPGQFPDPQYLALAHLDDDVYVLDADLSHIWRFKPGAELPETYYVGGEIGDGVDMTIVTDGPDRGTIYVLTRAGRVVMIPAGAYGRNIIAPEIPVTWPAQILVMDQQVMVVDGESRTMTALAADQSGEVFSMGYRFSAMQRLRSVARAEEWLLAVAGDALMLTGLDAPAGDDGDCPPVMVDDALYFHGEKLDQLLAGYALPFPNATLPDRPRSYPGARRLYRYGIHTGMDLYANDAGGLGFGSPVRAIAEGEVVRIDHDYEPLTPAQFEAAIDQAEAEHRTNPELFELFMGRQVQLQHDVQVKSIYGHLDSTAATLNVGDEIQEGTPIGTVGLSGTSAGAYGYTDGVHLHYEIWIGDRYLGEGLSLYETMRIWQAIFDERP